MVDNFLGDADYYDSKDNVGFGVRLVVMCIDLIVILLIGIMLWIPFLILILAEIIQSDPSGVFWIVFLLAIWVYLAPIKDRISVRWDTDCLELNWFLPKVGVLH